jgi:dTDP-glucose 4,6-dehydratase
MRVLITGGEGFIGTHLCAALEHAGHDRVILDRANGDDLLTPGLYAHWLKYAQPDIVVHLAAQVGRLFGEDDVRHSVRSNVEMTTLVAHETAGKARLLYVSSSEVYGDRGEHVCREDDPLDVLPHNVYGLTKRQAEECCRLYMPPGDLAIARLSMPYGPGAPPGRGRRAMDTMLWQALHRMPLTVHRGAERSWCHIGDTINGLMSLITGGHHGAYNIGRDDDPRTMLWLAQTACELAGAPTSLIRHVDPPARQTVVKRLSTDKIRALGWRPQVELEDGLIEMAAWVSQFDRQGQFVPERQAA